MIYFNNVHVIDQTDCLSCRISKTAIGMHSNRPVRENVSKSFARVTVKVRFQHFGPFTERGVFRTFTVTHAIYVRVDETLLSNVTTIDQRIATVHRVLGAVQQKNISYDYLCGPVGG